MGAAARLASGGVAAAAGPGEAEAGASAVRASPTFPTAFAGGRSDFRGDRFTRYGGAADGRWGFAHGPQAPGFRRVGRRRLRGYPFAYGYGAGPAYGYGQGPYGPQEPYGDSAGEVGYPPPPLPYAPALAQGPYGPGVHRPGVSSPYRGQAYVSGGGAYAYGYNGFAETPALGPR